MIKKISIFVLILLIVFIIKTLYQSGAFKIVSSRFEGQEVTIGGVVGVEDLTVDHEQKVAYLSSHDRRKFWETEGAIFVLDLKTDTLQPRRMVLTNMPHEFRPHGFSLLKGPTDFLFVVNHRPEADVIDCFEIKSDTLFYKKSFHDTGFISPNDVQVISENTFYFTNDHNSKPSLLRTIEDFLKIGTGYVAFYDGSKTKQVSASMPYANGVCGSKDGKYLYAASTTDRAVYVYERQPTGNLKEIQAHAADSGVDNIELDAKGNIWVGAHLKMLDFLSHSKDATKVSSGEVFWYDASEILQPNPSKNVVYVTDGKALSGLSVGVAYENVQDQKRILVGGVFDPKIVVGKMK